MNQTIRTFRAATADEALAQVRREMGLAAEVLDVKRVSSGGLFGWLSSRQEFEVRAVQPATSRQTPRSATQQSRNLVASNAGTIAAAAALKLANAGGISAQPPMKPRASKPSAAVSVEASVSDSATDSNQSHTRTIARKPDRAGRSRSDLAPPPPLLPETEPPRNGLALHSEVSPASASPEPAPASRAQASRDSSAAASDETWQNLAKEVARGMLPPAPRPTSPGNTAPEQVATRSMEQRLDVLQQMIADLGRRTEPRGLIEIPPELFPHYMTLIEADVEEGLARELIVTLHRRAAPGQLADTASTMALLTALIEQRISCDRALALVTGRRQIAMVVGPTGVGKTTTLAKLAGRFGVQQGCKLGLITVDTYRVAAVEQLRTYAEIIDLPMRIVTSAAEMQEALDSFLDCDLVLIDTAGRSPHDDRRLTELKQLIDAVCPDHVYLVLSLASGANALRATAERFAAIRPTSLVFTKLDEATGCGGLLSAARDIGLPISYFTTGQEVPRDIEPANPCRAARLILGTDSINGTSSH